MSYDENMYGNSPIKPKPIEEKKEPWDWKWNRSFEKKIYNYKSKTQQQIFNILSLEVDYLKTVNTGFSLGYFSKPIIMQDGSLLYTIHLKKD